MLICREGKMIDKVKLQKSIAQTFKTRGTTFAKQLAFADDDIEKLQTFWNGHLRSLGNEIVNLLELPNNMIDLVMEVNQWLENAADL